MDKIDPFDKYEKIIVNRENRKVKMERRKVKLSWENILRTTIERVAREVFPNGIL